MGIDELLGAHRALAAVDPADRSAAYFALRATLCSRRDDFAAFDAAFAELFAPPEPERAEPPELLDDVASLVLPRVAVPGKEVGLPVDAEVEVVPAAWSDAELLRDKDFADYTDAERRLARRLIRRIAGHRPHAPEPAHAPARRRGAPPHAARPDLRRTIRSSLRTGGDPFERHWREPAERPRPLVLVCDVSGSMEPYARMLLQYMQACVAARRRVEAFVFGTRLTRVTAELAGRDPDRASTAPPPRPVTGPAARASARRSRRSTASTGAGSAGARSWCCSPTDGTAATPSSSRPRWRGCSAARTSSCG